MKVFVLLCLLALASARPDYVFPKQSVTEEASEVVRREPIRILRDDRFSGTDGQFAFDIETEDGIFRSESGRRLAHVENQPIGQQGIIRFTFPNGEKFNMKYVADENGFQPESSHLPVAPVFPHPIPQFVIDQIEFAAREDAEKEARRRLQKEHQEYQRRH